MHGDDPRAALAALASERGASLAALSRLIGRNAAYLQQFVQRGTPRRLAEDDRRLIAAYLGVDEGRLGGADRQPPLVRVPLIDAAASAGPGALVDDDRRAGGEAIDPALLRRLGVRAENLSIITARGDSMLPTIADGDELLVDRADRKPGGDALFVARIDGTLVVKRLTPAPEGVIVTSDNPAYPARSVAALDIIGRVVRLTRRLK